MKNRTLMQKSVLYKRLLLALGLCILAVGLLLKRELAGILGFSIALSAFANLRRLRRVQSSPETLEAWEIGQKEERNQFLFTRAAALSYSLSIGLLFVAMLVLALLGREDAASLCAYAVCAMLVLHVGVSALLRRRY